MPELPEVQTTVNGLNSHVVGHTIIDVWSDYNSSYFKGSNTIKDPEYFVYFKKEVLGRKIVGVQRRAKNILIELSGNKSDLKGPTIIVHMKMTGHLLYGRYQKNIQNKDTISNTKITGSGNKQVKRGGSTITTWTPIGSESLKDPFNRHIRFVMALDNNKHLALCDTRRFAKVALIEEPSSLHDSEHLKNIGPEPLDRQFTYKDFIDRIFLRPNKPVKIVLMDQKVIAGIGNIYADESLWRAGIHPLQVPIKLESTQTRALFKAIKTTLSKGINLGGDSMSDYRNIHGEKGKFQETHRAYRKTGSKCSKKGCHGKIVRIVVGGRSTHYCDSHQVFKHQ